MPATASLKDTLFHELSVQVRTSKNLIAQIQSEHHGFRPHPSMRPLHELVTHLSQIPCIDLAILKENDEITIRQMEKDLVPSTDKSWVDILEEGTQALIDYMNSLSEDEFIHKKTKAWYHQEPQSQAQWLIEIITHLAHHRAQMFDYLKQLEYNVKMYDLY